VAEGTIRLVVPDLGEDELREIAEVLASGFLTQGPKVLAFEAMMASIVGVPHAIATTSATTALHLVLAAEGIGPGDEVIVPDFTFPATANVVIQQGARPVLADIDLGTFTMDPSLLPGLITDRTRAIIPVHAFGVSADMDPIVEFARDHGLIVIEDAACAIGTTYHGRACGTLGDAGCFSFHPRKAMTTGEGGLVTTADEALAERARLLRSHGGTRRDGRFTFEAAGFNYRMSDILAAIGIAQARKLGGFIADKRRLATRYRASLAGLAGVVLPAEPAWGGHVYQSFVVLLDDAIDRDAVILRMRNAGIETTLGTYALHDQPFFQRTFGYRSGDLPRSDVAFRQTLTLPLYPGLSDRDQDRVSATLAEAVSQA
jgi:perosamine synthetase